MNKLVFALSALMLGAVLVATDADAERLGGGRSVGTQRNVTTPPAATPAKPAQQPQQAAPAQQGSKWGMLGGILGGLALGGLLAWALSGTGLSTILLVALLAIVAFMAFRAFGRRRAEPAPENVQFAGMGGSERVQLPAGGAPATTRGGLQPYRRASMRRRSCARRSSTSSSCSSPTTPASSTRSASSPPASCSTSCARTCMTRPADDQADRRGVAQRRSAGSRYRARRALGERALLRHGARDAGQRAGRVRGSLEPRQAGQRLERLAPRRHPADALRRPCPAKRPPRGGLLLFRQPAARCRILGARAPGPLRGRDHRAACRCRCRALRVDDPRGRPPAGGRRGARTPLRIAPGALLALARGEEEFLRAVEVNGNAQLAQEVDARSRGICAGTSRRSCRASSATSPRIGSPARRAASPSGRSMRLAASPVRPRISSPRKRASWCGARSRPATRAPLPSCATRWRAWKSGSSALAGLSESLASPGPHLRHRPALRAA